MHNLPKLTPKAQQCLLRFFANGQNQSDAYRFAFDCSNSLNKTVWQNASKFFNSTKVAPWIEYYRQNQHSTILDEFNYSQSQHFQKLNELQDIALFKCFDRFRNPNISAAIKVEELKGKMAGCYDKKNDAIPCFDGLLFSQDE